MKTYYAYIRVSTVKQGEQGVSLDEQRDAIERYAASRNLNIVEWFEETVTAAKQGRRLFTRMITALEKGKADGVILHKVDRGARNLFDWARLQGLLDRNIEVHFVHESLDLNSRGGRLTANLQAVIAADYIWNLRDEVRKGITGRLKQGLYPMSAPVGYVNNGKGKPKTIDPVKGPLVRHAFELYATGRHNFDSLRTELYRVGLRSRAGKKISKCGLTWILTNAFYIGLIHIKTRSETYQGIHEPLIPPSLFNRVQTILHGRYHAKVVKHDFVYRRLLSCAHCGYALIGEQKKGHIYYRCHTKGCATKCIREEAVEQKLQAAFAPFVFDDRQIEELRDEMTSLREDWGKNINVHIKSVRLRLGSIDDRLQRLTDAYLDRLIERDAYSERRAGLLKERAIQSEKIDALTNRTEFPADESAKFLEQAFALWLTYKNGFPHERRNMVQIATSNLSVDRKSVVVELRMPFRTIAMYRKFPCGAPHRDEDRTEMKKLAKELWEHFAHGSQGIEPRQYAPLTDGAPPGPSTTTSTRKER